VSEDATTLRTILRELPRRRVALLVAFVVFSVLILVYLRALDVGRERAEMFGREPERAAAVAPWSWSSEEWAGSWPWTRSMNRSPNATTRRAFRLASGTAASLAEIAFSGEYGGATTYGNATWYKAEESGLFGSKGWLVNASDASAVARNARDLVRDEWGQPIRFRVPGQVHTRGWDAWSIGPNGIDEQGQGDDILIGEDVAPVVTK
jgi:hypothetical protein